uniref:CDK-activating kinase assembly factor MAT1 n=1 Tax=Lingulaulax polyedra TaxID=160621 RepID=A0A516AGF7_LINPO|nr:CDK-activating kinase assembly factor MAT1 [Lingulodinium polyedra]
MNECLACHVDYYHNPDVRVFFSVVCDHPVCEPCITRLFQHGRTYPCPACGQSVRAEDFSEHPREARQVESEVKVRRQICDIYCKTEDDFQTAEEYNDYLMQREDTIFRLVNPSCHEEVQETWRCIDQYRELNAEQILRVQRLQPRKKFQKILSIIEEEGVFCSSVNAEWGERGQAALQHPFQARYRTLLEHPPEDQREPAQEGGASPFAPQPLLGEHGPADTARQMSGGGQTPEVCLKKARHFFFSDLVAATSVIASAA